MRMLQLGVGAVGEVTARVAAGEPAVEKVILADVDESRLRDVAAKLPPGKAETRVLDASDHAALVAAAGEADLVLNALATAWDIPVMEACLDARRHYLDMGTGGPREITGTADLDEQFALHDEFLKRDTTAMVSFGIDPGVSDVFARALYDQFDTVEKLLVLDGDNATVEGYDLACSFNVETMIEECLLPPTVFRDGREDRNEALSVFMDFEFPEPVGRLTLCNVDHEESQLMPMFLAGKGLRDATFFIALDPAFVDTLRVFKSPGAEPARTGGVRRRRDLAHPLRRLTLPAAGRPGRQAARRGLRRRPRGGHHRRRAGAPLPLPDHLSRRGLGEVGRAGHRLADGRLGRVRRHPVRPRRDRHAGRGRPGAAGPGRVHRRDGQGGALARRRRPPGGLS